MNTKYVKYARSMTVSFDNETLNKIETIQRDYLIDRSNIIRTILTNMSVTDFSKLLKKQVKKEKTKRMVKRKLNYKS